MVSAEVITTLETLRGCEDLRHHCVRVPRGTTWGKGAVGAV